MNSNDFYKSKYSKYKNKYLELKQKNQEGGILPTQIGTFLFYIPIGELNKKDYEVTTTHYTPMSPSPYDQARDILIVKNKSIIGEKYLSYDDLYNMSILVIPLVNENKIASTTEWFLPNIKKSTSRFLPNTQEPKKWTQNKNLIDLNNDSRDTNKIHRKLFCVAKDFLQEGVATDLVDKEFLKLVIDGDNYVICLKYKIYRYESNKLVSFTDLFSFNSMKTEIKKIFSEYSAANKIKYLAYLKTVFPAWFWQDLMTTPSV